MIKRSGTVFNLRFRKVGKGWFVILVTFSWKIPSHWHLDIFFIFHWNSRDNRLKIGYEKLYSKLWVHQFRDPLKMFQIAPYFLIELFGNFKANENKKFLVVSWNQGTVKSIILSLRLHQCNGWWFEVPYEIVGIKAILISKNDSKVVDL